MSLDLVGQVMRQRIGDRTEKLILIAFAEHSNADGLTYPSVDLVAAEAQCSARTVQRAVKRLIESGLLVRIRSANGRGYPAIYAVRPDAIGEVPEYWELRQAAQAAHLGRPHDLLTRSAGNQQRQVDAENSDKNVSTASTDLEKGDKSDRKGDKSPQKGDIAVSPEPVTLNLITGNDDNERPRGRDHAPDRLRSTRKNHNVNERPHGRHQTALDRPAGRPGSADGHRRKPNRDAWPGQSDESVAKKTARAFGLLPRQHNESASQFTNRIRTESTFLATIDQARRRLNLPYRKTSESFDDYCRRVTDAELEADPFDPPADPVTDWREARRLATGGRHG